MDILLAEDEDVSRAMLGALLKGAGHKVTAVANGADAWDAWLLAEHRVVISDWMMPQVDGLELCRRVRARRARHYTYIILLTARSGTDDYLTAMEAGVDDFVTKPPVPSELKARLGVAERILGLRAELMLLEGLLPVCSYCKRLRNDQNEWSSLEGYVEKRSNAQFSHGICPDCYAKHVEPQLKG